MKIVKVPEFGSEIENLPFRVSNEGVYVKYFEDGVQAGFPSPADDFKEQKLSLDEKYLSKPNSTYIVRVKGDSMYPTLHVGDILVVRTDINLDDNKIGIISLNNTEFTVKRFDKKKEMLIADNVDFKNIEIKEEDTLMCLGVVMQLIREIE
ncbi:MAG: DNA repair protein [Flavobacteriaceae bacterium]|nr:DNA repair protein [Flavobacteriaceae bacterium]